VRAGGKKAGCGDNVGNVKPTEQKKEGKEARGDNSFIRPKIPQTAKLGEARSKKVFWK